jgi:hypothetical protein
LELDFDVERAEGYGFDAEQSAENADKDGYEVAEFPASPNRLVHQPRHGNVNMTLCAPCDEPSSRLYARLFGGM